MIAATALSVKDNLETIAQQLSDIHQGVFCLADDIYECPSNAEYFASLYADRIQREIYELQNIIRELDA